MTSNRFKNTDMKYNLINWNDSGNCLTFILYNKYLYFCADIKRYPY
jgi:hypothetical protein